MILKSKEDLINFVNNNRNKIIVTTNGCFDIVHRGHIDYLNKAKLLGDLLIVGINSDSSVKRLKGEKRPINNQEDRAFLLDNLKSVDAVFIFEEDTPIKFLEIVKPNIHVKGADYQDKELPEAEIVKKYGGEIRFIKFIEGYSTTNVIKKILES